VEKGKKWQTEREKKEGFFVKLKSAKGKPRAHRAPEGKKGKDAKKASPISPA